MLYYTILYYTILYYTILYYTVLYYTILYYTLHCYTILYKLKIVVQHRCLHEPSRTESSKVAVLHRAQAHKSCIGSMYCPFKDSGCKNYTSYGFWKQTPKMGSTWTFWEQCMGLGSGVQNASYEDSETMLCWGFSRHINVRILECDSEAQDKEDSAWFV